MTAADARVRAVGCEEVEVGKFNLLEDPWIPVLRDGQVREVGLGEVLLEAHTVERIETPSPLEEASLHRLLLAVLYRAQPVRDEDDSLEILDKGSFDRTSLERYLDRYHERFYLFHKTAPFLQIADLPDDKPLPWSKLLPELASGNNPTLFDHTTEENVPQASYSQAARALLVHQSYALGGLLRRLGVTSAEDAPLARPAVFLPTDSTLLRTLVLNLVPEGLPDDVPTWETAPLRVDDVARKTTRWPLEGAARVYSWPSRGVRLLDDGDGVRNMAYGPGVEPQDVSWRDPMVAYRLSKQGKLTPLRLSMEKSFWRDFAAMLPGTGGALPGVLFHAFRLAEEAGASYRLRVLGQVSDQAKVYDVRREVYPLPRDLLSPAAQAYLRWGLELAEGLGRGLGKAAWQVARGTLGDRDLNELQAFAKSLPLLRLYWAELDAKFPGFLNSLEGPEVLGGWSEALRRAAWTAWDETRKFVGTESRHLKALVEGEGAFAFALAELKKEVRS